MEGAVWDSWNVCLVIEMACTSRHRVLVELPPLGHTPITLMNLISFAVVFLKLKRHIYACHQPCQPLQHGKRAWFLSG